MKIRMFIVFGVFICSGFQFVQAMEENWQFSLTPYLWAMGQDGEVGLNGLTIPVDVDFSDAVKDLEVGGMLNLGAHNGVWGVLLDASYLRLKSDAATPIGNLRTNLEQWIVQGSIVYRIPTSSEVLVDLGVGGRFFEMDLDVKRTGGQSERSRSEGWIDPLLVARLEMPFATNCFGMLLGDIGGFGVESDLTWQLTGVVGYSFTEKFALLLGYRYIDYDYDQDGLVYNVATSGVSLGVKVDL
jgi:opacity protein-like surface antigen